MKRPITIIIFTILSSYIAFLTFYQDDKDWFSMANYNYNNCSQGGDDCYYTTKSNNHIVKEPPALKVRGECFKNTISMNKFEFKDHIKVVYRCKTKDAIGEYNVVLLTNRKGSYKFYMVHIAYASLSAETVPIGEIVGIEGDSIG